MRKNSANTRISMKILLSTLKYTSFSTANEYLTKNGFVLDALPIDYLDKKPKNMAVIRSNLKILLTLLDPSTPEGLQSNLEPSDFSF
jgi:hypothetical protein